MVAERAGHPGEERGVVLGLLLPLGLGRLLLVLGVEIDLALGDRLQPLTGESVDGIHPDLVDRIRQEQHLETLGTERL